MPASISGRWPEIQRIALVEAEWANLPAAELEEKAKALRRQIVGAILPSGAAIYAQEIEDERQRGLYSPLRSAVKHYHPSRRLESWATVSRIPCSKMFKPEWRSRL